MNNLFKFLPLVYVLLLTFAACKNLSNDFDASGNFEAEETIVSSEATGRVVEFAVAEGQQLKANEVIGYIDTTQLFLRKKQLTYSMRALLAKQPDMSTQLAIIKEQIKTAEFEKKRIENLLKSDAATQKQLDDLNAQLAFLQRQYNATKSSLSITSRSLQSETLPLKAQVDQLNDQIKKSILVNPRSGTVLTKYVEKDEVTAPGKALYKIANLETMTLRAYLTGTQLPQVKLGQSVDVLVADGKGTKSYSGTIAWISDKAEFTPKTIQTKEERANLVYAVKISVKNDGYLKLGMYADVKLDKQ
jgi:HlyD family secretion protein